MLSYPQRPNCLKQSHWGLDFSIQATIGHQHSSHSNLHSCSTKGQSQGFPTPFLQHHHCNLQFPRQWSFHALVFCSFINFTRESRVVSRSILLPRTLKGAQVKPLFTEKLKAAASIGPLGCSHGWLGVHHDTITCVMPPGPGFGGFVHLVDAVSLVFPVVF